MNVLVLGGTGAIGVSLTPILSNFASRVVVTSRQARESVGNIDYVQGDAKNPVFLERLLDNHWDAIVDFMIYSTDSFGARLDRLLSRTDQYIFLSSARVYADSDEPINEASSRLLDVSEDKEFLAKDAYPLAKARQENFLFKSERSNWTIIRPYITYGTERLQLGVLEKEAWLYRALCGKTVVFSEDILKRQTTLTSGKDVARGIAKLIGEPGALGEAFHITGENHLAWEAVLEIYRRAMAEIGCDLNVKNVDLGAFISCHNGEYQIIYDRIYDRIFDNSKIGEFVNVRDFEPTEKGLYQSASDFLQDPHFRSIDWPHEGIKDRLTGEFTDLRKLNDFKTSLKYLKNRFFK